MSSSWVIFVPLFVFLIVLLVLGRMDSQKNAGEFLKNYFLGDRTLKGFVLAMTLVATYGSVSSFVSGPGLAWRYGLGWVVYADETTQPTRGAGLMRRHNFKFEFTVS